MVGIDYDPVGARSAREQLPERGAVRKRRPFSVLVRATSPRDRINRRPACVEDPDAIIRRERLRARYVRVDRRRKSVRGIRPDKILTGRYRRARRENPQRRIRAGAGFLAQFPAARINRLSGWFRNLTKLFTQRLI
jgi:hypothetical protein